MRSTRIPVSAATVSLTDAGVFHRGMLDARSTRTDRMESPVTNEKSILTGVKRGLARRCPNCGKGRLFRGYLKVRYPCEVCGTNNTIYPSDDFPPYLTILVAGHVLVALFMWSDRVYAPPLWLESAIWLPATVMVCLALLPFMKGATVELCWATNSIRRNSAT